MKLRSLIVIWMAGCAPEEDVQIDELESALITTCSSLQGDPGQNNGIYHGDWKSTAGHGSVLACNTLRQDQIWNGGLWRQDWVPLTKRAIQYRFMTRDAVERPVPATAMLLVPNAVPAVNREVAPLIAIASGTAGLADVCAPSIAIRRGEAIVNGQAQHYLSLGMTVVIVDYIGSGTELKLNGASTYRDGADVPYLEGVSAAHVINDALLAARTLPGANYHDDTPYIPASWPLSVTGGSQGGHAALWATLRADVPFQATIAGAPPIDLPETLKTIDAGVFSPLDGFILSGFFGSTDAASRNVDEQLWLTELGKQVVAHARTQCITEYSLAAAFGIYGTINMSTLIKNYSAFKVLPQWLAWNKKNSLATAGKDLPARPATPVFVFHGALDSTVPPGPGKQLMLNTWTAAQNTRITTLEADLPRQRLVYHSAPLAEHLTVGGLETETGNRNGRYAPFEWFFDSVFGASRLPADMVRQ